VPDRQHQIAVTVWGMPVAQPRHRVSCRNGYARVYLPSDHAVHGWKELIAQAAAEQIEKTGALEGALALSLDFMFPAQTRRAEGTYRVKKPDLDNLVKAVMDALTDAGAWQDDAQVAEVTARKRFGTGSGVDIKITSLDLKVA
jgi:Holliday junction resolvase RusA-like endonuclease